MSANVLLVGETWTTLSVHVKGWDHFWAGEYGTGARPWIEALETRGHHVTWLSGEAAPADFPLDLATLSAYDVVVLSDIGARSLLLHPDVWRHGRPVANRLELLREWTESGGGLAMCGGYLSFSGSNGAAAYAGTAVEAILPVTIDRHDDRIEVPEGISPHGTQTDHPLAGYFETQWPEFLGYNRVTARPDATVLATFGDDPFVAARTTGAGRTLVWTSDIGPHWCPQPVLEDERYPAFWSAAIEYLAD